MRSFSKSSIRYMKAWKAFTKEACVYDPPEGSKELTHQGDGTCHAYVVHPASFLLVS